jgi:hypothetical protein
VTRRYKRLDDGSVVVEVVEHAINPESGEVLESK